MEKMKCKNERLAIQVYRFKHQTTESDNQMLSCLSATYRIIEYYGTRLGYDYRENTQNIAIS